MTLSDDVIIARNAPVFVCGFVRKKVELKGFKVDWALRFTTKSSSPINAVDKGKKRLEGNERNERKGKQG